MNLEPVSSAIRQSRSRSDREALIAALNDGRLDIIATDHAPHTWAEKDNSYFKAPAGLPLVQHVLQTLFELAERKEISLELLVDRACHAPADLFGCQRSRLCTRRLFRRSGYC